MTMKVQVILKENIKPSSPTPIHLKTFKLSLLDQVIVVPYAPIALFYPNYENAARIQILERLEILRRSLSETLTRFYPLAGTIKDGLTIDCNDEGAYYSVAEVDCCLSEFLDRPNLQMIEKFLPCEPFNGSGEGTHVANIQVNVFECGGIVIGLCISHKILDGSALKTFLKGWANTASGLGEVVYPNFDAPLIFPANDLCLRDASMVTFGSLFRKGNPTTKRFVFDASAVSTLKARANEQGLKRPTRVEIVSAFIWERAMATCAKISGASRPSVMTHLVNLRKKMAEHNLEEDSMGNLIWIASTRCGTNDDHDREFGRLVDGVREGISNISGDFVKKMRGDDGVDVMSKSLKNFGDYGSKEGVDYFGFTSWCKLGYYEIDFGWGKPVWVSSVGLNGPVIMNFIVLIDTKCGEGIEAWVTLDEEEMDVFGGDLEVKALASMDPSPLNVGN